MAKYLIQLVVVGTQVVGRAFARALQQELAASRTAAAKGGGGKIGQEQAATNNRLGMNLEEAKQILNLKEEINIESVTQNYEHLFNVNDKSKGGSFYIQSKKISFDGLQQSRNYHSISQRGYCTKITSDVFSEANKLRCLEGVKKMPFFNQFKNDRIKKMASVLVPFCIINGCPSVLLTLRSSELRNYKGDVSFPGGKPETNDTDLIQTALRETQEEIGLDISEINVWGQVPSLPSRTATTFVSPVLATLNIDTIENLPFDKKEVELIFTCSLDSFCDPNNVGYTQFRNLYTFPVYKIGDRKIWGLTAVILHLVLLNLIPNHYKFKIPYQSIEKKRVIYF